MFGSCSCCRSGTYVRPGCIYIPNQRPPFGDPFGGCLRCRHPESSHRKGWY